MLKMLDLKMIPKNFSLHGNGLHLFWSKAKRIVVVGTIQNVSSYYVALSPDSNPHPPDY